MILDTSQNINIYCDESRHTNLNDRYMVIGAISCHRDNKEDIYKSLYLLKKKHKVWREFGWKTLSPNKKDFYWSLIEYFHSEQDLRFRCIVVDKKILDHDKYSSGDEELGFYKLYYQMLIHWLQPSFVYYIYLDWQQNKDRSRCAVFRDILKRKLTGKAKVACMEPLSSKSSPLIQLTDLFIGAVGYSWNERQESDTKIDFCKYLASSISRPNLKIATLLSEIKFNIFRFQGR